MSDKIRKYVLPNLPYLFVFWFFSKIGTAYRIAPGTDFGTKLMGMLDTFPKAFETYWPGLGGIDLLVGLAGVAGMYLLIQSKIRQAKKFRRDAEYGTARFGTKEDIKPFVDPKFQNNVILTGTEFLTMNTRPKIPANARNLNACVIGSSGSGKTRFWLTPQLLQAHSSYVVVDPKGGTLDQCGRFLQREKYRVRVFNSIDFSKSMHYNPLAYIKTESDVLKFVTALITNTKGDGKEGDEFWTKAETLLYCALVAYIVFEGPEEERNMNTLVEMINSMEVREDDETFKNAVDYMFDGLERRSPQHFAVRQYKKYKLASGKTGRYIRIASHTGRYVKQISVCCLNGIRRFQQFFVVWIAKADSNNKVFSAPFPDFRNQFCKQTDTVFKAAAVFVLPLTRFNDFIQIHPMRRMEFYPIKTGCLTAKRSRNKSILVSQKICAGDFIYAVLLHRRKSGQHNLHQCNGRIAMNGIGNAFHSGNAVTILQTERIPVFRHSQN